MGPEALAVALDASVGRQCEDLAALVGDPHPVVGSGSDVQQIAPATESAGEMGGAAGGRPPPHGLVSAVKQPQRAVSPARERVDLRPLGEAAPVGADLPVRSDAGYPASIED